MSYFSFNEWKFKGFEKSKSKNKKYDAILINKETKKEKRISFGDANYGQFNDSTSLDLYSNVNNLDKKRRDAYRLRHEKDLRDGYYSAGYFSWYYLW